MSSETDLIKERLDLAEIIGEYVSLKQAGQHFKGLCPFHQEKTPSFIVSPTKGIWHCFGCQRGGDLFSFVQEKEGIDFPTVLTMLAERAGVTLATRSHASTDRRQRLFELLALAARFYHEILMRQPVGKRAREYLAQERGVQLETMRRFQIGYAPQRWDTLLNFLRSRSYNLAEAQAAGVVGENVHGKLYDRFRGRIMFPITDVQNRVVAFGGRIAPWYATGNEGKYVNSPETELYEKRSVVFNLDRAKHVLRRDMPAIIVEGYLDVIMLVQAGVENVVATSGTAFTAEHIAHLARFTHTLHFAFDADVAGVKAALAATRGALGAGLRVATIVLPTGKDPADVAQDDPQLLAQCLQQPQSLIRVLFGQLQRMQPGAAREDWLKELLSVVQFVANPVQQGEAVQEVAALLHVPETQIIAHLQRMNTILPPRATAMAHTSLEDTRASSPVRPEHLLLGLAIISPAVRRVVIESVGPDEVAFFDRSSQLLYNNLQGLVKNHDQQFSTMSTDDVLALLPEELLSFAEGIRRISEERLTHSSDQPQAESIVLLHRLRQRSLAARLHALHERLVTSQGDQREQALRQFRVLTEALAQLETQR